MASKNISFSQIPSGIRKPGRYFEFSTALAVRTLPENAQKVLIVAQRLPAGQVAALVPTKIFSDGQAADSFVNGSMAHLMTRAAINANQYLDLTVCALDDAGAGAAATGTVTITGPATGPGVLRLYIGNRRIEIAVATADAQNAIATALKAEIDKLADLPVTAAVATNVITLTARHKGTVGNQIDLVTEVTAKGVTSTVVAMANGATDPDVSTALAKVFAEQYDIIITPYNDSVSLGALKTHLDSVSGPVEQRPAIGVFGIDAALATATTLATGINSGRILGAYLRGTKLPAYEIAAAAGAVIASETDPAAPLNTLPLVGIAAPPVDQRLSRTEQESCLANGITPLEVGPGEVVQFVRAISTYVKDAGNVADISLLDITTIRTLDYARKAFVTKVALRFPRSKKTARVKAAIRSELLATAAQLEELEILENIEANKDGFIVEDDLQSPTQLNVRIPADVVNGLHVIAGRIDLIL